MDAITVQRISEDESSVFTSTSRHTLSADTISRSSLLHGLFEDLSIGTSVCVQALHGYVDEWAVYRSGDRDLSNSSVDDASLLLLINVSNLTCVLQLTLGLL